MKYQTFPDVSRWENFAERLLATVSVEPIDGETNWAVRTRERGDAVCVGQFSHAPKQNGLRSRGPEAVSLSNVFGDAPSQLDFQGMSCSDELVEKSEQVRQLVVATNLAIRVLLTQT